MHFVRPLSKINKQTLKSGGMRTLSLIMLHIILVISSPKQKTKPMKPRRNRRIQSYSCFSRSKKEEVTVHFDDRIENGNSVEGDACSVAS